MNGGGVTGAKRVAQAGSPHPDLEPVDAAFEPADPADLQALEALSRSRLPPEFVDFVGRFGRSACGGEATIVDASGVRRDILTFYSTREALADLRAHVDYVENRYLPVACSAFGDRYVIALDSGQVCFILYLHGRCELSHVADSFSAFLAAIEVRPHEDELLHLTRE